jgi:hypothetical protein
MKIAIGVPMPQVISNLFNRSLIELITYSASHLKEHEIYYMDRTGVRTDKNRNVIIKEALEAEMDYILWLDADMIYPADMLVKYMEQAPFDVIGCVYYKRKYPYEPCVYMEKGTKPTHPYKMVNPLTVKKDAIIEVDGLGFGGVMVSCNVYKAMGDDKWMVYAENFHLPYETIDQETHDLTWCRKAKQYGFKILCHTGVKAGHIMEKVILEEDFIEAMKIEDKKLLDNVPTINILIPTIDPEKAVKLADFMKLRAGIACNIIVEEDLCKIGYVAMINKMAKESPADFFVYAADDVYPSRGFLRTAYETMVEKGAGLVGFNEGKFQDGNAGFGLVDYSWVKDIYEGNILNPMYRSHYSDPELTMIAKQQGKFAYNPRASLMEIVYDKDGKDAKDNNLNDRALFRKRKETGFDGKVTDSSILESIN